MHKTSKSGKKTQPWVYFLWLKTLGNGTLTACVLKRHFQGIYQHHVDFTFLPLLPCPFLMLISLFVRASLLTVKAAKQVYNSMWIALLKPPCRKCNVFVMPRKVTVKIGDAENQCRWCRDKTQWKRANIPVRLVLSRVPFKSGVWN